MQIPAIEIVEDDAKWYVMRDLKRANAKLPAYLQLKDAGFEVYTPTTWELTVRNGKHTKIERPIIRDLLFVHSTHGRLNPIVEQTPTLQFRYKKGGAYKEPIIVRNLDMHIFMTAAGMCAEPQYFFPDQITPEMTGRRIRIIDGPLIGYEGHLQKIRGTKTKHVLVRLADIIAVSVTVDTAQIALLPD